MNDVHSSEKNVVTGRNRSGYASNNYGSLIVNAETGISTSHSVGSLDEYLYYKIIHDGNVYFYDSPEQYLRHRFSRMRYRPKNNYDKMRKDEMLENKKNTLVHWSLVDAQGQSVEKKDKHNAYMSPFVNAELTSRWVARRAEHISKLNINSNDTDQNDE